MTQRPCSSSSTYRWTYDVFLSFRGLDTRYGFTGSLYNALDERGIHAFMDEDVERGEEITPSLFKAIEESRFAIVVFSKNHANSAYCLEELVKILECIKGKGRLVWPIFYGVDPREVRYQKGPYGEALATIEERFKYDREKVHKWKLALHEAANLSGWHFQHGYEYEFIRKIVEQVARKIYRSPLPVAKYPVGLEPRVQEIISLLDVESNERVNMVGIYGIGGIGKTTIACAVYNFIADQFQYQCFLSDIRKNSMNHGLVQLQETLLSEIVGERNFKLGNVKKGITKIKSMLQQKKVLLVLDDVDKSEQLEAIAGELDWFGDGSKIIITTRDKHLLHVHGVERTCEMRELSRKEALELFSWNAFKSKEVNPTYMDISKRAVLYSTGLPLVLEMIGSNLSGKTLSEWKSALDAYERIPDENIQNILKISYDDLKGNEKAVFLDMACFFRGYNLKDVMSILLNGRGFSPEYCIGVLIDKSLIKIDQYGFVRLHNLVEDMGREIVRQQSPLEPGERSRLWLYEDILHVLEEDTGTEKIEAVILNLPKSKEVRWRGSELKKMKNLKILIIENAHFSRSPEHLPNSLRVLKWRGYPSPSLPPEFDPKKLVILDLSMSCLRLDKQIEFVKFESLSEMDLRGSKFLKQVPDISGAPKLTKLYLDYCKNLEEVHDSIGSLDKLTLLSAIGCTNLRILPRSIKLTSLEYLSLRKCSSLSSLPNISKEMKHIKNLDLRGTAIKELPFSFRNLVGLKSLVLDRCKKLYQIPSSILMLPKLERLTAMKCGRYLNLILDKGEEQEREGSSMSSSVRDVRFDYCNLTHKFLAACLPCFPNVEFLFLSSSTFKILPECISECHVLKNLILDNCKELQEIRGVPPKIKYLSAINCISLTNESQSMLLTQRLHEGGGTDFTLPGVRIPEWFDHCSTGPSLSFWFRKKFPRMALAVVGVLDKQGSFPISRFHLLINGIQQLHCHFTAQSKLVTYHVFLSDVQLKSYNGKMESVYGEDGWNHVEVSYVGTSKRDFPQTCRVRKGIIKWMGVHVYKGKSSMEDVRFTNPKAPKRACQEFSKPDLDLNCHPLPKRTRQTLDIKQHQVKSGNHAVSQSLWKEICSIEAPPNIKILMWNICQDALPTNEYLFKRKLVNSPLCPICGTEPETVEHVFLFCPWTRPLWFGSNFQWSIQVNSVQSIQIWLCRKFEEIKRVYPNANQVYALVGNICWAIWKGRNEFVLEDRPVNPRIFR